MKNNIATKIKISAFVFIISLIYFSFFDLLYGRLDWFLMVSFWPIVLYSFISVFIYPYIKIDSQNLLKRGLFFGAIIWIVDLPQLLITLRQTLMMLDISGTFLFIKTPLYFIILGLIISFCYKKFLSEEFNLPLKKLKIPFTKIILAIILTTLIYSFFMFFATLLIFYIATHEHISSYITNLLHPLFYINPLLYGLIFTLFYAKTIGKVNISRIKKWILFSIFISFFTTPLMLLPGELARHFFATFYLMHQLLLIPHILSIFLIGYLFTKFLDRQPQLESLSEIKQ